MTNLNRITCEYIESEDRIRISGESDEGIIQVFWLSQRLLMKLLPHVLNWLEQDASLRTDSNAMAKLNKELLLGFAQQAASEKIASQPAVLANPECGAWLVNSVDIGSRNEALKLTLRGSKDEQSSLFLQAQELRQLLAIIRFQWVKADWPLAVWPDWMNPGANSELPKSVKDMH